MNLEIFFISLVDLQVKDGNSPVLVTGLSQTYHDKDDERTSHLIP